MDFKDTEMGILLDVEIFNQFFKEYKKIKLEEISIPNDYGLDIRLAPKIYEYKLFKDFEIAPFTALHVSGILEIRTGGQPDAAPIFSPSLEFYSRINFVLKANGNLAPTVGLSYDGLYGVKVEGETNGLITVDTVSPALDKYFKGEEVQNVFENIRFDFFNTMIDGIETKYYPDASIRPYRKDYTFILKPLNGDLGYVDSIGAFFALPYTTDVVIPQHSILPDLMGLGLVFSKKSMNTVLSLAAAKIQSEPNPQGATMDVPTIEMADRGIYIKGSASKKGFTTNYEGVVQIYLDRGTTDIKINTGAVEVEVDKPWWYYPLKVISFVPFVHELMGYLFFDDVEDGISGAPSQVHSGLGGSLGSRLDELAAGLKFEQEVDVVASDSTDENLQTIKITTESTPDSCQVISGNILLYGQVFVSELNEHLKTATYHYGKRRFVEYELESGRKFRYSELARLMNIGKILVPHYHDVNGEYLRSNHDRTEENNLIEEFTAIK